MKNIEKSRREIALCGPSNLDALRVYSQTRKN